MRIPNTTQISCLQFACVEIVAQTYIYYDHSDLISYEYDPYGYIENKYATKFLLK